MSPANDSIVLGNFLASIVGKCIKIAAKKNGIILTDVIVRKLTVDCDDKECRANLNISVAMPNESITAIVKKATKE